MLKESEYAVVREQKSEGLVSIIIPTYNSETTIEQTLESCLGQSYSNYEIIVVNDGSSDKTDEIVNRFSDPRIRYFFIENHGLPYARNLGIKNSRGEFLQFLDADDTLFAEKLEKQVCFLQTHKDVDLVYCFTSYFREESPEIYFYTNDNVIEGRITRRLFKGNFLPVHAPIFRTCELLFDENLSHLEDWDFWLRYSILGKTFACIPEALCAVRVRKSSKSAKYRSMLEAYPKVLDKYEGFEEYKKEIHYVKFVRYAELGSGKSLKYLKKLHRGNAKGFVRDFSLMIFLWTKCYMKLLLEVLKIR